MGIFLLGWNKISAQIEIGRYNVVYPQGIDKDIIEKILNTTQSAFNDYQNYASIMDDDGQVTQAAISKFNTLFRSNATILNDLVDYPETVSASRYGALVFNYLREVNVPGVYFNIENAIFQDIKRDPAGYFTVEVVTNKRIYTYLTDEDEAKECKNGRLFELTIVYKIFEENLEQAKILEIQGEQRGSCSDASSAITIWGKYGVGFATKTASTVNTFAGNTDFLNMLNDIEISSNPIISFGISYDYKLSSDSKLTLSTGVNYSQYNVTATFPIGSIYEIEGQKDKEDEASQYEDYTKIVSIGNNSTETNKLSAVELSLGARYKLYQLGTMSLWGEAYVIPIYAFGGTSEFDGEATYRGSYENIDAILSNIPTFAFTTTPVSGSADLNGNFSLAFQLSPAIHFTMTDNLGLKVALDGRFGINALFKSNQKSTYLLNDEKVNVNTDAVEGGDTIIQKTLPSSILEDYFDSINMHSVGLRVGLIYQL